MSETSFNIGEIVVLTLQTNNWETAIPYSLYDKYEYISKTYPIRESFNRYVRKLKAKFQYQNGNTPIVDDKFIPGAGKATFTEGSEGAVAESTSTRIKTLEGLLEACKVDLESWYVASHTVNTWEQNSVDSGVTTLFQVKANLGRVKPRIPVIQPIVLPHITRKLPPPMVKTNKSLIIGDAQIGFNRLKDGSWETFHDRRAMDIILRILEDHTFDNIVILGDMIDATEASRYTQKPEFAGTLQPSINELGIYLEHIRRLAPTSKIIMLNGNHEARLQNSMIDNLKYAYGLTAYKQDAPLMSFRTLLALDSMDIEFIEEYPSGAFWINKNVKVIHGEFVSLTKELATSDTHTVAGHLHKTETLSRSIHSRDGIRHVSAHTIGCLCKIDNTVPGMTSRPNWNQGFAVVDHVEDFVGINHGFIQDGTCLFQGKKYIGVDEKPGGVY